MLADDVIADVDEDGDVATPTDDDVDCGVMGVALFEWLNSGFFFLNMSCMLAGWLEDILSCLNFLMVSSSMVTVFRLLFVFDVVAEL